MERLLDAGRELFGERGFEATRVADIAERAGCSVGVFYQRFSDKHAYLDAVRSQFIADTEAALDATLDRAEHADAVAVLDEAVDLMVGFFRTNAALHRAFLRYEATHPEAAGPMLALADRASDRIARAVIERSPSIDHADPRLAVRFASQVLRGVLIDMILHPSSGALSLGDRRLTTELRRLLHGYLGLVPPAQKKKGHTR